MHNDKTCNIILITHFSATTTRGRKTTDIAFFRQNGAGSRACSAKNLDLVERSSFYNVYTTTGEISAI